MRMEAPHIIGTSPTGSEPTMDPGQTTAERPGCPFSGDPADRQVMGMLSQHVPLSLIMDLSAPAGPDSTAICDAEGEPEQPWWDAG
jgi:hypothetical protein